MIYIGAVSAYKLNVIVRVCRRTLKLRMLKFAMVLCALSLPLATNNALIFENESHPKINYQITKMYQKYEKRFDKFNRTRNSLLVEHGNRSLRDMDLFFYVGMSEIIDEIMKSEKPKERSTQVCLEYWATIMISTVKSKIRKCVELQKQQLQIFIANLRNRLTSIAFVDMLNGSQNCANIIDPSGSKRVSTICYRRLKSKIKNLLQRFGMKLTQTKVALHMNDPLRMSLKDCRPLGTRENFKREYLDFLNKTRICSADAKPTLELFHFNSIAMNVNSSTVKIGKT